MNKSLWRVNCFNFLTLLNWEASPGVKVKPPSLGNPYSFTTALPSTVLPEPGDPACLLMPQANKWLSWTQATKLQSPCPRPSCWRPQSNLCLAGVLWKRLALCLAHPRDHWVRPVYTLEGRVRKPARRSEMSLPWLGLSRGSSWDAQDGSHPQAGSGFSFFLPNWESALELRAPDWVSLWLRLQ